MSDDPMDREYYKRADREKMESAKIFQATLWPIVKKEMASAWPDASLIPNEGQGGVQHILDKMGIDYWIKFRKERYGDQFIGASVRVRKDFSYRDFTIRTWVVNESRTEWDKLLDAYTGVRSGLAYPTVMIQSFTNDDRISIALAKTMDIVQYVLEAAVEKPGYSRTNCKVNRAEGNRFIAVPWDEMREQGYPVKIIEVRDRS
jgi:hypothetical protein